jgi:hypothetical protein
VLCIGLCSALRLPPQEFEAPARALDAAQLGSPLCEQPLKGGAKVSIYRHRLAEANQYVRVRLRTGTGSAPADRPGCIRRERSIERIAARF